MTKRRHFNPFILHVMQLKWNGLEAQEIALRLGVDVKAVNKLLASAEAKEIYSRLEAQTVETYQQTQTALQAVMPQLLQKKIQLALTASNENVRSRALQDLLDMGGHGAIKHVEIYRPDSSSEAYADKSVEEIRRELLNELEDKSTETLH